MKKIVQWFLVAAIAAALSGCVCDGSERSFREIDRKYADSTWTAVALNVPIIGWCFIMPWLMLEKEAFYQKALLDMPVDDLHESIRWDNRFYLIYSPR